MRVKVALPEGDPRGGVRLHKLGVVTHEPTEFELTAPLRESRRGKGSWSAASSRSAAAAGGPGRRGRRGVEAPEPSADEVKGTETEEQPAAPAPSEGEV